MRMILISKGLLFIFQRGPYHFRGFVIRAFMSFPYVFPTCIEHSCYGFPFICAGFQGFGGFLLLRGFACLCTTVRQHKALGFFFSFRALHIYLD